MFNFYAQITSPQGVVGNLLTTLSALTRLSRTQIRVFSANEDWNNWGE